MHVDQWNTIQMAACVVTKDKEYFSFIWESCPKNMLENSIRFQTYNYFWLFIVDNDSGNEK